MATKNKLSYIRDQVDVLFPDNATGDISASDVRNFMNVFIDNMQFEGGGMRISSAHAGQTVGTSPQKLIGFTENVVIGDSTVADYVNNKITVQRDGVYSLSGNFSFGWASNISLSIYPAVNNIQSVVESKSVGVGTSKPKQIALTAGEIVMSAGDVIELYGNTDSSTNVIVDRGFLQVVYRPFSDYT